jgi:hypothetical protein
VWGDFLVSPDPSKYGEIDRFSQYRPVFFSVMVDAPKTVWVVGSGFSRSLGGPLLEDLLSPRGRAEATGRTGLNFNGVYRLYDTHLKGNQVNFPVYWRDAEEFLDFLETAIAAGTVRHGLLEHEARGYHLTLQEVHNQAVCEVASECLFNQAGSYNSEAWEPYVEWANRLTKNDTIITFNYDTVLEMIASWPAGKGRFHFPAAYGNPQPELKLKPEAVNVLKLHGSVTWFEGMEPLKDISSVIAMLKSGAVPIMGTPGPAKRERSTEFAQLWEAARQALIAATYIIFLGYRFPPSDSHARGMLLGAIRENDGPELVRVRTVLGPRTSADASVRLAKLLEYSLQGAGRKPHNDPLGYKYKLYDLLAEPLYVEDFFTVVREL